MNSEIYENVAKKLGIEETKVKEAYESYWKFIRETIESLDLKNITEEEFNKLRTSFNIPRLGKLHCSYRKKQREYYKNRKRDV